MKYFFLLIFSISVCTSNAQDVFQKELFSIEQIQQYRAQIKLTDDQLNRIRQVYNDNIASYNNLKWDLDAEYGKMKKMLSNPKLDSELSMAQMERVLSIETALKKQRLSTLISMRNTLNSDQQKKLKSLVVDNSNFPSNLVTPINENPRVMVKVEGKKDEDHPLYVVIGKDTEMRTDKIDHLDTNDIESLEVIKGEAAIEKYGDEGKNGVVIIRMKGAPKSGKNTGGLHQEKDNK